MRINDYSRWLPEERDALEDLAKRMPFNQVVEKMAELALVNGWPSRTAKALTERLRHSKMPVGYGNAITAQLPRTKWTPAEIAYLEKWVGEVPFPMLVRRMAKQAAQHGWPLRTTKAIQVKANKLGHQCDGRYGDWLTTGAAAQMLGCSDARVHSWIKQHGLGRALKPIRIGRRWYIKRSAWRELATETPWALGGYSADGLFMLLEDRELADFVARNYPIRSGDYRIRCIETGRSWSSACAAAHDLHISRETINKAIRDRRPVPSLGLTFEALRRPQVTE